jgi:hypothetical protein
VEAYERDGEEKMALRFEEVKGCGMSRGVRGV